MDEKLYRPAVGRVKSMNGFAVVDAALTVAVVGAPCWAWVAIVFVEDRGDPDWWRMGGCRLNRLDLGKVPNLLELQG